MSNAIDPEVLREATMSSLALYASENISGPAYPPYNGRAIVSEHHERWSDMIEQSDRVCILAPRDHGKSFMISRAYSLWMAEKNPGHYGFIFSASDAQAGKMVLEIGDEVESNPKLRHLLPSRKTYWSGRKLRLANGFTFYGRGYGTKVRGAHPIFVVADDVLNDEDGYSETVRNRNINYFLNAISNMPVPGGQIVVVGTPYAVADLYGYLSTNKRYLFGRFPAVNDDGKALWPERYNAKLLRNKIDEVGPIRFAREFMCSPVNDGSSLFPRHLFEGPLVERGDMTLGMPLEKWRALGVESVYMGVDFAVSANIGSDYTVIFTVGLDKKGTWYLMDLQRARGMEFRDQLALIERKAREFQADVIACESNQSQNIFGDELIRESGLPIVNMHTGSEKHSLSVGVPALRVLLEARKIRIPRATVRCRETTDIWIAEMQAMTVVKGKVHSVAKHDDCVMAMFILSKGVQQGQFSFSFDEQPGDKEAYDAMLADDALEGYDPDETVDAWKARSKDGSVYHNFDIRKRRAARAEERAILDGEQDLGFGPSDPESDRVQQSVLSLNGAPKMRDLLFLYGGS